MDVSQHYKSRLLELRSRMSENIQGVAEEVRDDIVQPTDISKVPTHPADRDVEMLDANLEIANTQVNALGQIDAALQRIKDGAFGKCSDCGRTIDDERLDAVPYTPYCIECARRHDRERQEEEAIAQSQRDALTD